MENKFEMIKEIRLKQLEIRNELTICETPTLRDMHIKQLFIETVRKTSQQTWAITGIATANIIMCLLNQISKLDSCPHFKLSLRPDFEVKETHDHYYFNNCRHVIRNTVVLQNGAVMQGVWTKESTILYGLLLEDIFFQTIGTILIENVIIRAKMCQCAIFVSEGHLTVKNCVILGNNSSTQQGIIVSRGARLELINSEITGFCKGIVGYSGSEVDIMSSSICSVEFGSKPLVNCPTYIKKSNFQDCFDYEIDIKEMEGFRDVLMH